MQTSKEHLATLRTALRDELGHDRDVLAGFGAFAKYDKNDLALDVHFRTGSDITDDELEWAYELVSSNLSPLGHRFKPQDKMDDLCDPSSRFFLVTERPAAAASAAAPTTSKGKGKGKGKKMKPSSSVGRPVAFAHFRFTVEGEAQDAMAGVPVLLVRDLHAEPAYQRKGVGKHLCQLLELVARKNAMQGVMMLTPEGDAGKAARVFMSSKLRGFENVDEQWAPADKNLTAFSKSFVKPPSSTAAVAVSPAPSTKPVASAVAASEKGEPAPAASPDSVFCAPGDDEDSGATPKSPKPASGSGSGSGSSLAVTSTTAAAVAAAASETINDGKAVETRTQAVARLETAFENATTLSPTPSTTTTTTTTPLFGAAVSPAAAAAVAGGVKGPSMSFADFGMAAAEEDVSDEEEQEQEEQVDDDDDSEWEEVDDDEEEGSAVATSIAAAAAADDEEDDAAVGADQADDLLGQLVDLFKAENGRDPNEEEMTQWVQTLKEAAAEGGLGLC